MDNTERQHAATRMLELSSQAYCTDKNKEKIVDWQLLSDIVDILLNNNVRCVGGSGETYLEKKLKDPKFKKEYDKQKIMLSKRKGK